MDPIGANQSQPKPPNLLTAKQVADLLQWNPYTIMKKAEKGELPGFKLGREWRFKQVDIEAWIEEKKNGR
jgi:excisionase family DNA binding protein